MLPDLDCMAINLERERRAEMMEANDGNGEEMASPQKFIDLLECIVDYDGNALYS